MSLLGPAVFQHDGAAIRRATPRWRATLTSRCCTPSCRSRSIRRRSASPVATRRCWEACTSASRARATAASWPLAQGQPGWPTRALAGMRAGRPPPGGISSRTVGPGAVEQTSSTVVRPRGAAASSPPGRRPSVPRPAPRRASEPDPTSRDECPLRVADSLARQPLDGAPDASRCEPPRPAQPRLRAATARASAAPVRRADVRAQPNPPAEPRHSTASRARAAAEADVTGRGALVRRRPAPGEESRCDGEQGPRPGAATSGGHPVTPSSGDTCRHTAPAGGISEGVVADDADDDRSGDQRSRSPGGSGQMVRGRLLRPRQGSGPPPRRPSTEPRRGGAAVSSLSTTTGRPR